MKRPRLREATRTEGRQWTSQNTYRHTSSWTPESQCLSHSSLPRKPTAGKNMGNMEKHKPRMQSSLCENGGWLNGSPQGKEGQCTEDGSELCFIGFQRRGGQKWEKMEAPGTRSRQGGNTVKPDNTGSRKNKSLFGLVLPGGIVLDRKRTWYAETVNHKRRVLVCMPVPYYLGHCHFILKLEIRRSESSSFVIS